jgi:putative spermidine/putrescine transport system permease protein
MLHKRHSFGDWSYWLVIGGLATLALVIMIGPVLVVIATSLTENRSLKFPPTGFSFQWYRQLFDPDVSDQIHRAAGNSLTVAFWSTLASVVFGTMAALAIARSRTRLARSLDAIFMSPMILPGLSFGLAALMYFTLMGFRPSLTLIMIGHALVIVPFVLRTSSASISQLDPSLLECSASLGASWFYSFRRITLPIIAPGIAAGAFLAFMASIDNVPISLFLSGPRTDMLPIRMWGMMESTLDVRVAAVSGVLIAVVLGMMLLMERLVGFTRRV